MNPEAKRAWLEKLRSKKFKQGIGALKIVTEVEGEDTRVEYCCLGILCEAAVDAGVIPAPDIKNREFAGASVHYQAFGIDDWRSDVLPHEVMEWAGLLSPNPILEFPELATRTDGDVWKTRAAASEWNDDFAKSFEEIADAIERTFPDVPVAA